MAKKEAFVPESVSVSLGIKVSLGNYNMANMNYSLSGSVAEGSTPEEAKVAAEEIVDGWLSEKLSAVKAKNGQ